MKARYVALAAATLALPLARPAGTGAEGPASPPPQAAQTLTAGATVRGRLDVGGHRLHLEGHGALGGGGPTVVLEAALGGPGSAEGLAPLTRRVAALARVCRYDRAGLGHSEPAAAPRTYRAMVDDLRALLAAAGAGGPYVLVGLGSGGAVAQLYAAWHPDEVGGLVLVNAPLYGQDQLLGQVLPPGPREEYLAAVDRAAAAEGLDAAASDAEFAGFAGLRARPAVPAVVLSPSPGRGWPAHWSAEAVAEASNYWSELQGQLLYLWPGATQVTARHSGHDLARDEPETIVAALGALLDGVARASATSSE
jgi:pimeloyl-ACP methyl ester carboxylesterase